MSDRAVEQLEKLVAEPVRYMDDPSFQARDARRNIFDRSVRLPLPSPVSYGSTIGEAQHRSAEPRASLTPEQERTIFLRYNYARHRASVARELILSTGPKRALGREALRWWRLSLRLRNTIVRFNLPLVLSFIGRMRPVPSDPTDLISEGNMALIRAVESFDVKRGLKFSTYGWAAINNTLRRCCASDGRRRRRFCEGFDLSLEADPGGVDPQLQRDMDAAGELRRLLTENRPGLTPLERTIVERRFGFIGESEMSVDQLSGVVGRSRERVRQLLNGAMVKIRRCLTDTYLSGRSEPLQEPAPA